MLKQFGSVYLILGTCIAAGMLGLPIVTAQYHFALTSIMIVSAWLLMSGGAWCLLQVNMTMPRGANFISMSEAMLGKTAKVITWFAYLMLLYSLICAYLSATGDLLQTLFRDMHIMIPRWSATTLSTVILGAIVYRGIRSVDIVNRFLMSTKFIICMLLIGSVIPFTHLQSLSAGNWHFTFGAWLVVITSFGYANILPSIRDYLDNDKKQLSRVILIGSIIPMILYFVWIAVIQGSLQRFGAHGLVSMNNSPNTSSLLMNEMAALTHHAIIESISIAFISICSVTGFLSVSLSLVDVLTDGFKREKHGPDRIWISAIAFLPPTIIVIVDPAIFIRALSYAGICCLYILVALPVAMYVRQRMTRKVK
ncbi:MAG: tryptophan/tyrosine permease [Gammaproteobacteria bacterium]|nr:tryptophan/tyrosine permease [Gammaproteobacteria bacterium]